MNKKRFYVGETNIPDWVQKLMDKGLIINPGEFVVFTYILTYKETKYDTRKLYLYDNDFLELNQETGEVTIGHPEWNIF